MRPDQNDDPGRRLISGPTGYILGFGALLAVFTSILGLVTGYWEVAMMGGIVCLGAILTFIYMSFIEYGPLQFAPPTEGHTDEELELNDQVKMDRVHPGRLLMGIGLIFLTIAAIVFFSRMSMEAALGVGLLGALLAAVGFAVELDVAVFRLSLWHFDDEKKPTHKPQGRSRLSNRRRPTQTRSQ